MELILGTYLNRGDEYGEEERVNGGWACSVCGDTNHIVADCPQKLPCMGRSRMDRMVSSFLCDVGTGNYTCNLILDTQEHRDAYEEMMSIVHSSY